MQESKKQLEIKKLTLNSFYKGFYFFSLPLNAKLRSVNVRKVVSNYGATKLITSNTLLKSSKFLLSELLISPTSAISDTSQILDILTLKPLDEPPEGLPGPNTIPDTTSTWIESLYYNALQSITAPGFIPSSSTSSSLTTNSQFYSSPPPPPATSPVATSSPSTAKISSNDSDPTLTLVGIEQQKSTKNPFDNVDDVISGPSIGGGEIKKSSNPFADSSSSSSTQQSNSNDIKIVPVSSPVKVNQNLLGDLLGGSDGKKDDKSSIWG